LLWRHACTKFTPKWKSYSWKCENVIFFGKILLALQNFFIFCIMKVFSGTIQHAKFEHRSPDKIKRYSAFFFLKWKILMTSAIDIKRYRTRAMAWYGASNCSRHVILEVLFILLISFRDLRVKMLVTGFEFAILEQGSCDNYIEPP
jgi:hypothetical protein